MELVDKLCWNYEANPTRADICTRAQPPQIRRTNVGKQIPRGHAALSHPQEYLPPTYVRLRATSSLRVEQTPVLAHTCAQGALPARSSSARAALAAVLVTSSNVRDAAGLAGTGHTAFLYTGPGAKWGILNNKIFSSKN